jgi:hypothetical protein
VVVVFPSHLILIEALLLVYETQLWRCFFAVFVRI